MACSSNMKTAILSALTIFLLSGCSGNNNSDQQNPNQLNPEIVNNPATAAGTPDDAKLPAFEFEETSFDFGTLRSGESVTHEYHFKNTGSADLLIAEAHGSCGCTVPEYPKTAVAPGDDAVIKVTFNSNGISGQVAKTVTLLANTIPSTKVLTISGEVTK